MTCPQPLCPSQPPAHRTPIRAAHAHEETCLHGDGWAQQSGNFLSLAMQGAEQPASSYFHLNGGQLTSEQGPLLTDRRRRRRARPSPGSSSDFDISIHRGGVKARPRWCHAASLVGSVSTALRQPGRIRTRGGDAAFSQLGKRVPRGPKQRPDIKRSYGRPIRENTLGKPKYLCCKERG